MKVRSLINVSLLIAAILLLIFGTRSLYQEGQSIEVVVPARQQELLEKQILKRRLDDLRATLGQITEEAKRIEEIIPEEPNIPEMIVSFEEIALRNGMILRNIEFGESVSQSDLQFFNGGGSAAPSVEYVMIQIKFGLSGSYEALEGLLRDMERNLRLIDVSSVSITPAGDEQGGIINSFEFSLQATIYHLK